jgi:hypothetical protein
VGWRSREENDKSKRVKNIDANKLGLFFQRTSLIIGIHSFISCINVDKELSHPNGNSKHYI